MPTALDPYDDGQVLPSTAQWKLPKLWTVATPTVHRHNACMRGTRFDTIHTRTG